MNHKLTLLTLTLTAALTIMAGCATANAKQPETFENVSDSAAIPQWLADYPQSVRDGMAAALARFAEPPAAPTVVVDEGADGEERDDDSEYVEYYEPYYADYADYGDCGYGGGSTATTLDELLNGQGRAYDENGTSYTWYPHDIGYGALDIPGETFDENGVSHDCDGYIVVATDAYEKGMVIETPYGDAKVYDSGCGSTIDVYTGR